MLHLKHCVEVLYRSLRVFACELAPPRNRCTCCVGLTATGSCICSRLVCAKRSLFKPEGVEAAEQGPSPTVDEFGSKLCFYAVV